jgi:hypothetical protein
MPELATFALLAFRQEAFVAEAIRAVGRQTYRPLELIVSDDASPDGTREQIELSLRDLPPDIAVIRLYQDKNQGLASAINQAAGLASGRVVILAAGDDISHPERVARTMEAFRHPGVKVVHSATTLIDEQGRPLPDQSPLEEDADFGLRAVISGTAVSISGASCAYAIETFRNFPPLPAGILREDVILPIRALLLGGGRFLSARLVQYRMHSGNLHSAAGFQSSEQMVARNLRFAEDRRCCCVQLAADAAQVVGQGGHLSEGFGEYLRRERGYSDLEQDLILTPSRFARLGKILAAYVRGTVRSAAAAKAVTLFVFPGLYAPLLKMRIQLKQRKRKMRHG